MNTSTEYTRLQEENTRLRLALNAMLVWDQEEPRYKTRNGVPMDMPKSVARLLKKAVGHG